MQRKGQYQTCSDGRPSGHRGWLLWMEPRVHPGSGGRKQIIVNQQDRLNKLLLLKSDTFIQCKQIAKVGNVAHIGAVEKAKFFTHTTRKPRRQPGAEELPAWYNRWFSFRAIYLGWGSHHKISASEDSPVWLVVHNEGSVPDDG